MRAPRAPLPKPSNPPERRAIGSPAPFDRVVIGLGNPGKRYAPTRHNLGFRVLDRWAGHLGATAWTRAPLYEQASASLGGRTLFFAKPRTFMNRSGEAAADLLSRLGLAPSALLILHDDLDLPFAALRIRRGGGHGGHNGVRSLVETLGTAAFERLKLGIGRPPEGVSPPDYVLAPFAPGEEALLPGFLDRATDAAAAVVELGALRAMHLFHTPSAAGDPPPGG